MGIDASNNIKLKQQEKDSPFLTLSERSQKGITSQNIFGGDEKAGQAQEPKRTERVAQLNIFGAEEGGQVKDDTSVFGEQEEKGCDEYFQENAQGEMNFDTNGFYGDAIGVSFGNSAASNPINGTKAGASDTKALESELKLMLRNPEQNKTQIENLKKQIDAKGGDADKIVADNTPKAGATKGANTKAGATEAGSKTANAGQTGTTNNTPKVATSGGGLSLDGSTSEFMASLEGVGKVDIVAGRGASTSTTGAAAASSGSSSEAGIGDAIKNAFSPTNIATNLASKGMETVSSGFFEGLGVNALTQKIGNGIKEGVKGAGKLACKAVGVDLDANEAKNAETVDEANKNVDKGQTAQKQAKVEQNDAKAGESKAKSDISSSEAEKTIANQEADMSQQVAQEASTTADLEEKAAETAKMGAEEKAAEIKTCDATIKNCETQISNIDTQINSINTNTNDPVQNAENTAKKAQLQSEKARLLAQKADAQTKKALATENKDLKEKEEAAARESAEQAKNVANDAKENVEKARSMAKKCDVDVSKHKNTLSLCAKANTTANMAIGKANVFTEASQKKLNELQEFHKTYKPNQKK